MTKVKGSYLTLRIFTNSYLVNHARALFFFYLKYTSLLANTYPFSPSFFTICLRSLGLCAPLTPLHSSTLTVWMVTWHFAYLVTWSFTSSYLHLTLNIMATYYLLFICILLYLLILCCASTLFHAAAPQPWLREGATEKVNRKKNNSPGSSTLTDKGNVVTMW